MVRMMMVLDRRLWLLAVLMFGALSGSCGAKSAPVASDLCPGAQASPIGPNLLALNFKSAGGTATRLCVRVEATEQARQRGLMNVAKLPDDEGDLFFWPEYGNQDVTFPFWMKDTLIPLTIAFVSSDGKVQEAQDMQAETETIHPPATPYRFAIEANQGWYARHNLGAGATVDLPGALISLRGP
jgi:uncharacterized membrane protein (UPF0127 family)